jgi:hypothetical protein
MDIFNNNVVKNKLSELTYLDLPINIDHHQIIIPLFDDSQTRLQQIFHQILTNNDMETGYYEMQQIFKYWSIEDRDKIISIIIDIFDKKITSICDAITDENGKYKPINLEMYTHIWDSYREFTKRVYVIIDNHMSFLTKKNIKVRAMYSSMFDILQIVMFYTKITAISPDLFTVISSKITGITSRNIDQLLDYIDSIRAFAAMSDFMGTDPKKLYEIISNLLNNVHTINTVCKKMHELFNDIT